VIGPAARTTQAHRKDTNYAGSWSGSSYVTGCSQTGAYATFNYCSSDFSTNSVFPYNMSLTQSLDTVTGTFYPLAHVFGDVDGGQVKGIRSAWETLLLLANGVEPKRGRAEGGGGGELTAACREALGRIDLHWHDLRHEGACRLYNDGLDIRTIQLMLGHSTLQQTQRYLNVTDEELREKMQVSWKRKRLQAVSA
jgi:hypothetical protein